MPTGGLIAGIGDFGVVDLINEATQEATAEAQSFADEANAAAQTVGNVVNRELQILPVKAGQAMNIGTPVYVSGADGVNDIVSPASNTSEATSSKVIGLLMQNLTNNGQGSVVTQGKLVGLNTSAAALGNPVWLGVNGALIYGLTNKPVAPAHLVYLGVVSRVHTTLGAILVNIQNGFEMNEIHDVLIESPIEGSVLVFLENLWRNKKLFDYNSLENHFVIKDENGNIALKLSKLSELLIASLITNKINLKNVEITDDTTGLLIKYNGVQILKIDQNGRLIVNNLQINASRNTDAYSVLDESGNIAFGIDSSGKAIKDKEAFGIQADITHFIMYGQSLSLGGLATPAISTTNRFNNTLMFSTGAVTWEGKATEGEMVKYASLIPLVEGTQETPASGFAEQFVELITAENAIPTTDYAVLMSCPGSSNTTLANLSKGTDNYTHLLKDIQYGLLRAIEQNKTYDVGAILFNQGEADATNSVAYKTLLQKMQKDLSDDISIILGRKKNVRIIIYQTASFNAYNTGMVGKPIVAYEQYDISHASKYITMSQAMYDKNYGPDNVHLTASSSKANGAYHAITAKRITVDANTNYNSISLQNVLKSGNTIELHFFAPKLPLVLDTINVTNPGNYGFRVFSASGTEKTILSVILIRGNTIKITLNSTVVAGDYVTYAANGTYPNSGPINGTRGNLRDSTSLVFVGLSNKVMYNWCPIFKTIIK